MQAIKKYLPHALIAATVIACMTLFLARPARYANAVAEGISLWAVSILPATFPFLFLTAILPRLRLFAPLSRGVSRITSPVFRVSGAGGCAALISMISGYPVGARTTADLISAGAIPREQRYRAAALATTTGPAFLVGAVGQGMFLSPKLGWLMLLSHYLGVWTVCLFLRRGKNSTPYTHFDMGKLDLGEMIRTATISILCVGGAIALFYTFGQMLADLGAFLALPPLAEGTVRGLIEMTAGCSILSRTPSPLTLALCCFLVTFGGLCVLVQQLAFLGGAGVKALPFLAIKAAQGAFAAAYCYSLALAFGV